MKRIKTPKNNQVARHAGHSLYSSLNKCFECAYTLAEYARTVLRKA